MVPLFGGFWVPWSPRALPPIWPFCWWVAAVVDHYSRRVLAWRVFWRQPTAEQVVGMLDWARVVSGGAPRYMVTDQGSQFRDEYRGWCDAHGVTPRYGAVGRYGSIAVIERFWGTMKREGLRRIVLPLRYEAMCREVQLFVGVVQRPPAALVAGRGDSERVVLPDCRRSRRAALRVSRKVASGRGGHAAGRTGRSRHARCQLPRWAAAPSCRRVAASGVTSNWSDWRYVKRRSGRMDASSYL